MRALFFWLAAAVGSYFLLTWASERDLTGDEIQDLFSGSRSVGQHTIEGYGFERHYSPNGTFLQSSDGRTGAWSINGSQLCIRWRDAEASKCRFVRTDRQGKYWKYLIKRNGGDKIVVRYDTFTDPDGNVLGERLSDSQIFRENLASWRGFVVLAAFAVFLIWLGARIRSGAKRPDSFVSRVRRRLFKMDAGGFAHRADELPALPEKELERFTRACVEEERLVYVVWAFEAILEQSPGIEQPWGRMWRCLGSLDDALVIDTLRMLLAEVGDRQTILAAVDTDVRRCYLMGKALMDMASDVSTTDEGEFTRNKEDALHFFEHVRSNALTPAPDMILPATSQHRDYVIQIGQDFEALTYMKYTPPAKPSRSSSSSYSGGG